MSTALTERDFYEVSKDIAPAHSFSFEEAEVIVRQGFAVYLAKELRRRKAQLQRYLKRRQRKCH